MTNRERILRVMGKLPENATFADAIYRLEFLQSIQEGVSDAEHGLVKDADEFFDELLNENEKKQAGANGKSAKKSTGNSPVHSERRPKNRRRLHKTA